MPKQFRNVFVFLNEDVAGVNFMAKKEDSTRKIEKLENKEALPAVVQTAKARP
jgi:hypothetical protein